MAFSSVLLSGICRTFCDRAVQTWQFLNKAQVARITPREETITENNLIEIQIRHPNEITVHKFSPAIEGRVTGADWEWWLGSEFGWLGLRIQAKKLNPISLQYDELDQSHKVHGRQVDLLIQDADRNEMTPLYCFYNYWNISAFNPKWNCKTFNPDINLLGCTISSAKEIKRLIDSGDKSLKSISEKALPWNCLVCCRGYSYQTDDLVERAKGVLFSTWGLNAQHIHILRKPPNYVLDILRGRYVDTLKSDIPYIMVTTDGTQEKL